MKLLVGCHALNTEGTVLSLKLIEPICYQDSGYFPSPTGGARKKRVLADEDGVVGVIERVCSPSSNLFMNMLASLKM